MIGLDIQYVTCFLITNQRKSEKILTEHNVTTKKDFSLDLCERPTWVNLFKCGFSIIKLSAAVK